MYSVTLNNGVVSSNPEEIDRQVRYSKPLAEFPIRRMGVNAILDGISNFEVV